MSHMQVASLSTLPKLLDKNLVPVFHDLYRSQQNLVVPEQIFSVSYQKLYSP